MDSIIEKLSDIENTAEAIVEHAQAQKYEICLLYTSRCV